MAGDFFLFPLLFHSDQMKSRVSSPQHTLAPWGMTEKLLSSTAGHGSPGAGTTRFLPSLARLEAADIISVQSERFTGPGDHGGRARKARLGPAQVPALTGGSPACSAGARVIPARKEPVFPTAFCVAIALFGIGEAGARTDGVAPTAPGFATIPEMNSEQRMALAATTPLRSR